MDAVIDGTELSMFFNERLFLYSGVVAKKVKTDAMMRPLKKSFIMWLQFL